jgi:hypothetical protein
MRMTQRVCLLVRYYGCGGWRPKGRRYAACRPAGTREALPGTKSSFEKRNSKIDEIYGRCNSAVRKHLSDSGYVSGTDQRQLLQLAHPSGSLGAHQMAFAGVHAFDFAIRGNFETLFRAAVGL